MNHFLPMLVLDVDGETPKQPADIQECRLLGAYELPAPVLSLQGTPLQAFPPFFPDFLQIQKKRRPTFQGSYPREGPLAQTEGSVGTGTTYDLPQSSPSSLELSIAFSHQFKFDVQVLRLGNATPSPLAAGPESAARPAGRLVPTLRPSRPEPARAGVGSRSGDAQH